MTESIFLHTYASSTESINCTAINEVGRGFVAKPPLIVVGQVPHSPSGFVANDDRHTRGAVA